MNEVDQLALSEQLMQEAVLDASRRGAYIIDDVDADRALKKLGEMRMERESYIAYYKERMDAAVKRVDDEISMVEEALKEFFTRVPHHKTKTTESYALKNGKITQKRQNPEIKRDEAVLLPWLKENAPQFVKTQESVIWDGGLKKFSTASGDGMVFGDTGECIPGITLVQREDKFVIDTGTEGEA